MYFIVLCFFAENVRIGLAELGLVEILAEFLAPLGYFLLDFLLYFSEVVLDEIVCTISLLGVLIVNERVIESSYVTGSNPCLRMHEHAGINADHIFVKTGHRLPPIPLDIVLEFHSHLTIVINCSQTVINLAGREYESILLAMRHQDLEKFFLCHKCLSINYLHYYFYWVPTAAAYLYAIISSYFTVNQPHTCTAECKSINYFPNISGNADIILLSAI